MKILNFLIVLLLLSANLSHAEIKVASALGDNMVLQRNTEVKLWGTAKPNERLTITTGWDKSKCNVVCNENGKWLVKVKTAEAGGPYTISITSKEEKVQLQNILLGEVWLCSGQSNMEMPIEGFDDQPVNNSSDFLMEADDDNLRMFTLTRVSIDTPQDTCEGSWKVASAESVSEFSAVGYLFAKQLRKKLNVPVGVICSSWGGSRIEAWMSKETMSQFPEALKETSPKNPLPAQRASRLYNGMISPILNCTFKGAIWYQGESNIPNYQDYAALMKGMLQNWRHDFGLGNFPFYYVQISPFCYEGSKGISCALQRDEQLRAMSMITNCGMISTFDIGSEVSIHPAEKYTVAKRLALWAFSETYGIKGLPYKTPTFKSMTVKDSVATLSFDNIGLGLNTFGKEVECFEVAGADKVFYPAKMTISARKAHVSSPKVKEPVAVRYGFCNYPKTSGYLYNNAGLPVCSFRTDNW